MEETYLSLSSWGYFEVSNIKIPIAKQAKPKLYNRIESEMVEDGDLKKEDFSSMGSR